MMTYSVVDCDAIHKLRPQIITEFLQNGQDITPEEVIHWDNSCMFVVRGILLTVRSP